jgi:hypothetical protein
MTAAASPNADAAVAAFTQAAELNRSTPARIGNVLQFDKDNAADVLVSADLHGHRRNFDAILALAALDRNPRRHLIMQEVCHGGPMYPGGGCMSHQMLEDVAKLKVRYPDRFHFLLSNHELAELTDFPIMKSRKMLNVMFRLGLKEAYGDDADKVRAAAMAFIASCPLAGRVGQTVFICHSCPERSDVDCFDASVLARPYAQRDLCDGGSVFRLVWGRDFRAANAAAFAKAVNAKCLIHGHEPCPLGYRIPNVSPSGRQLARLLILNGRAAG